MSMTDGRPGGAGDGQGRRGAAVGPGQAGTAGALEVARRLRPRPAV